MEGGSVVPVMKTACTGNEQEQICGIITNKFQNKCPTNSPIDVRSSRYQSGARRFLRVRNTVFPDLL